MKNYVIITPANKIYKVKLETIHYEKHNDERTTHRAMCFFALNRKGYVMPKTKFQDVIFTCLMVIVMVYAMICYNMSIEMGGLSNQVFLLAFLELPIMGAIAFLLDFFLIGKVSKGIAFQLVHPTQDKLIFIILAISSITVCFMCPLMSFFATLLFKQAGSEFVAVWFQTTALNFPMALCWQLFFAGPIVRFVFKRIFKEKEVMQEQAC